MYLLTIIILGLLAISFYKDNRSLWNPALLIVALFMIYLSLAKMADDAGFVTMTNILFSFGFVIFPVLLFLSALFLIYNGFILLKKEGRSKANYLSLAFGIIILLFFLIVSIWFTNPKNIFEEHLLINDIFIFLLYSYFIFGFAFAGYMIYSFLYLFIPKRKQYDFIIIHGAGLLGGEKVTPLLKCRIDKAVEAYHYFKNPQTKLIASGGQGHDEKISEAQAIYNYLTEETNIPKEAILLEDKSTTTYENLLFSKKIGEELVESPRFLFVTNDYHVFRTSTYARRIGMKGDGLGCRTASYYIPSAFIREYVALCVRMKWLFVALYMPLLVGFIFSYQGILW